jgi:hypothetical protein
LAFNQTSPISKTRDFSGRPHNWLLKQCFGYQHKTIIYKKGEQMKNQAFEVHMRIRVLKFLQKENGVWCK